MRHPRRTDVLVALLITGLFGAAPETGFPRLVRFVPLSLQRDLPRAVGAAGAGFTDARPIAAAASERLIHGPRDWKHLNRVGYEALARAILGGLPRQKTERRR